MRIPILYFLFSLTFSFSLFNNIYAEVKVESQTLIVTEVPKGLGLNPFYKKYLDANGIPVVSSSNVRDEAFFAAKNIIVQMLSKRDDVRMAMITKPSRVMIIGENEEVCDLPEYADICNTPEKIIYWNRRARGFGGDPESDCSSSCGEENLLKLDVDRYRGENILVHEFAHLLHSVGLVGVDPDFNNKLRNLYDSAKTSGLWKRTYAMENKEEYFAEAVQSFFNTNRYSAEPNGVHGPINTRIKLKEYDPAIYKLLCEYFYDDREIFVNL